MTDLEYKSKVVPITSATPVFNMKKALKSFAIVSEGLSVKELRNSLKERMTHLDTTHEERQCLQIILSKYDKMCKKIC